MRILDRERYWAFFKAYVICFTALVGLNVVIDAFSNFDEFAQRASGLELFAAMGRYYLVHMSQFYDRLCGVISMMAAIFTVTWMQKNNELLAMLAAGVSTYRVIRPVIVSAIIVSSLAVFNQEVIMPRYAEELQRRHADDGNERVGVHGCKDASGIYIHGRDADRTTRTVTHFYATVPVAVLGSLLEVEAGEAQYIPPDDLTAPYQGGWVLRGAVLKSNATDDDHSLVETLLVPLDAPTSFGAATDQATLGLFEFSATAVRLSALTRAAVNPAGGSYFLRTDVDFQAVTRRTEWYMFAPTLSLIQGLFDSANAAQRDDIAVFLHSRLLRPLTALSLMLMSLPLVLSGYGRSMFLNLGRSLGTSALFYAALFASQYLGAHRVVTAEFSAWLPLIGFGSWAMARWGKIRT